MDKLTLIVIGVVSVAIYLAVVYQASTAESNFEQMINDGVEVQGDMVIDVRMCAWIPENPWLPFIVEYRCSDVYDQSPDLEGA